MDCLTHDEITRCIEANFHKSGRTCKREVEIGNRRVDLECDGGYIEVKRTCEDFTSTRSHEQICDMKHHANNVCKPLSVRTPEGCYIPLNEYAHEYLDKHDLPQCPNARKIHCCELE